MLDSLTIELQNKLKSVDDNIWTEFFLDHPDSASMINLMQDSGTSPVEFKSLVIKSRNKPAVILPLFITQYSLLTTVIPDINGKIKDFAIYLNKHFPQWFQIKVLGIGFVEGEYGEIGLDKNLNIENADYTSLWDEIIKTLKSLQKNLKLDVIAFKDFTTITKKQLPKSITNNYICANSLPFCVLDINFKTLDEYLKSISHEMKRYLNHSIKKSSPIEVIVTNSPKTNDLDTIYSLYNIQVEAAELSFGKHNQAYFDNICKTVPGAQYVLFYLDSRLIGFDLIVTNKNVLVQKYIAFDKEEGRKYNLYFRAFIEKIKICLAHNLTQLYLGASLEETKSKLGCHLILSYIYFQHKNPIINYYLQKFKTHIEYTSAVAIKDNVN